MSEPTSNGNSRLPWIGGLVPVTVRNELFTGCIDTLVPWRISERTIKMLLPISIAIVHLLPTTLPESSRPSFVLRVEPILKTSFGCKSVKKYLKHTSPWKRVAGFCPTNPAMGPFPTPVSISHLKPYTWTAWLPENDTSYMTRFLQQMIWSRSSDKDIDFSFSGAIFPPCRGIKISWRSSLAGSRLFTPQTGLVLWRLGSWYSNNRAISNAPLKVAGWL